MTSIGNRTVLVTGGARRLGRRIAEALAANGWSVVVHYRDSSEDAEETVQAIRDAGGQATGIAGDLETLETALGLIETAAQIYGPLSALINNASVFERDTWDTLTPESWSMHMDTNLRAPLLLSQAFADQLDPQSTGSIINIIDQRVWNLTPTYVSYTVSKSGLWALTQILAKALAPRIRVNAVGPGPTLPNARQSQDEFNAQSRAMPLGHGATPDDIANAVLYLLGASAVTGQMIAVDGGEHLGWAQPAKGTAFDE